MRRIFVYFMAALAAAFLWVIFAAPNTYAVNATWENANTVNYDGNTYRGPASKQVVGSFKLSDKNQVYTYVEPEDVNNINAVRKIHILYFETLASAGSAQPAKYKSFTYLGPYSYSDPSTATDITIDPQPASTPNASTCNVEGGLGWIICPTTKMLARGVDWVFGVVSSFLTVTPTTTNPDSALFKAWTYMRSFANVAFVIGFLIIIYSQLTSFGISNYGIKKLLPRLIIAALLVNLSYYVCAIAVDISNILGHSIQAVFINIRNNLMATTGNSWDYFSWDSVTGFILSGGTAAAVGITGLVLTLSTYGIAGSLFLLLPALVSALMAVLVALLVLAARQAVITILIILAPLAFVAYLLPNTEKWFEKWQSTFMTMLIIFPAFSVIFGGSQLASAAIIQSADSLNLIILGLLVQTAPLFITPILLKLSGSMLNKVAGLVSNTNKGIVDRTRKFTEDRSQDRVAKRLGTTARPGAFGVAQRNAQRREHNRRKREGWKSAHTGMADARWAGTRDFSDINQIDREAGEMKKLGETRAEIRYNRGKNEPGRIHTLDTQLRSMSDANEHIKAKTDATYEIYQTDSYRKTQEYKNQSDDMKRAIDNARDSAEGIAIQGMRKQSASHVKQNELGTRLEDSMNVDLRNEAGASIIDPINGPQRARAAAINVVRKAHAESIANATAIIERGNLTDNNIIELALGKAQIGSNGQPIDASPDMIEAAITKIASGGNVPAILSLTDQIDLTPGTANEDNRIAFVDALRRNSARPKHLGFGWLAQVTQGIPGGVGESGVDEQIINTINAKKMSADAIVAQDPTTLSRIFEVMEANPDKLDEKALLDLKSQIQTLYETDRYSGRIEDRDKPLQSILELLPEEPETDEEES